MTGEDFVGFCQSRSLCKILLCFLRPLIPPASIAPRSSPRRLVGKVYVAKRRNPVTSKLPQEFMAVSCISIDARCDVRLLVSVRQTTFMICGTKGGHIPKITRVIRFFPRIGVALSWGFACGRSPWCLRASVMRPNLIICSWQGERTGVDYGRSFNNGKK